MFTFKSTVYSIQLFTTDICQTFKKKKKEKKSTAGQTAFRLRRSEREKESWSRATAAARGRPLDIQSNHLPSTNGQHAVKRPHNLASKHTNKTVSYQLQLLYPPQGATGASTMPTHSLNTQPQLETKRSLFHHRLTKTSTDNLIGCFCFFPHRGLSLLFLDRDHGRILKTFTRLESCDTDPWVLEGAQSRLRQLRTNLVTVDPECNFWSNSKNTHHPPRPFPEIRVQTFSRPKQKQNRKHDDTEKTP